MMESLRFRDAINKIVRFLEVVKNYGDESAEKKLYTISIHSIIKMLYPFIPHIMEEIWEVKGKRNGLSKEKWPKYSKKYVDQKIKNQWNAYDNLIDDIKSIIKVIKDETVKTIKIIVADEWRSNLVSKIRL